MSSTPEAVVAAYFDALNSSNAEALTSLFDEDGGRWVIAHYMYNSADNSAGTQ